MYTAAITNVENKKISLSITVEFYLDGVLFDTITVPNIKNLDSLNRWVASQIQQYETIKSIEKSVVLGDVPVVSLSPTADDIYTEKKKELYDLKMEFDLGIVDQATYATALADTVALKP